MKKKVASIYFILIAVALVLSVVPAIAAGPAAEKESGAAGEKVNINTAGVDQLAELPGIGAKTAGAIVSYREEHGSFASIEQLMDVKGIGDKKFEVIRDSITIE